MLEISTKIIAKLHACNFSQIHTKKYWATSCLDFPTKSTMKCTFVNFHKTLVGFQIHSTTWNLPQMHATKFSTNFMLGISPQKFHCLGFRGFNKLPTKLIAKHHTWNISQIYAIKLSSRLNSLTIFSLKINPDVHTCKLALNHRPTVCLKSYRN